MKPMTAQAAIAWLDRMREQAEAYGHPARLCMTDVDWAWCQACDYTWHPDTVRVMKRCSHGQPAKEPR